MWYGLSNVAARFLNYLLTFLHVQLFNTSEFGDVSIFYASAALLNILFTYGMETAFFRFVQNEKEKGAVYSTGFISLLLTTLLLSSLLIVYRDPVAALWNIADNPEWVTWLSLILAADTLAALPFAVLRQQNKPRKYAAIKIANILLTIGLQVFFFFLYPQLTGNKVDISFVFLSNLVASVCTLLFLFKEIASLSWTFHPGLWKKMMRYSLPLIIVGLGGMINETIDRHLLLQYYEGTVAEAKSAVGIYSANYKLSILIMLFIQAFRMGAEPFFFQQSVDKNAPRTYARVMKFFVLACCLCFLFIVLFLDLWKSLITTRHPAYGYGIMVVPILALSKLFLGIYYNLSIWYKLTDKNTYGALITIGGALLTIGINIVLIPYLGYFASAWATLACYTFMMVSSYLLGQKYYPIPYATKKITAYIIIALLLFGLHQVVRAVIGGVWPVHLVGLVLFGLFSWFVLRVEHREFRKMPLIGRFYSPVPTPPESASNPNYP